jgi:hypothetical protein
MDGACSICHRWFWPDPRVGARQKTCSKGRAAALRVQTQARWREHNPDYAIGWRIQTRQQMQLEADPPGCSDRTDYHKIATCAVGRRELGPARGDLLWGG